MPRPRTIRRVGSLLVLAAFALTVAIAGPGYCQDRPLPGPAAKALSTDPSWIPTGSLNTARAGHTATLLTSGKVLVVGGNSGSFNSNTLDSAELYDPVNGTWSVTGRLKQSRSYHTATLLPNGLVLVAGGAVIAGQSVVLTSTAELYDPVAGEWRSTGDLKTGRELHTATLLQNGNVLVAGGIGSENLDSAELYDPATGMWSRTGNLVAARYWHTATLLQTGKALVAGGQFDVGSNLSQILKSAELYDPVSGTWNRTTDLNAFHSEHTATRMQNGKVLVASGDDVYDYDGTSNGTAEIYDPGTATWSYTGNLGAIRDGHTATLLPSGKVLVTGGVHFSTTNGAELYDPVSGTWTPTGNVSTPRFYGHTATLLSDGKVLVAGGTSENNHPTALDSAELYEAAAPPPGTIDSSFTGAWYDPAQSGHGLFVEILPGNRVFVGGMTFNPAGTEQAWFAGIGTYSDNTATIPAVTLPTGGRWIPNFNPNQIINNLWGTLTFTFTDGDHGKVDFNSVFGYGTWSMNLTRLTRPAGVTTTATLRDAVAPGTIGPAFTGAWYDPAQSGHGLFVEVLPENRMFVGWFTFNPSGTAQAWFVGAGSYDGNTATITPVSLPTGGRWIPNFDANQIMANIWGTLIFTFTDCNQGKVDFNSVLGYGTGSMKLTRLTQPAGLNCP